MRAGTPTVVARQVPSVDDIGSAGPSPAHLVDPLDEEDIADGLTAVLTQDVLRADLSGRGRAYVEPRTWRASARAHVALWEELA
jgi:glycosyltransferase involved in cell wall biosynthesis